MALQLRFCGQRSLRSLAVGSCCCSYRVCCDTNILKDESAVQEGDVVGVRRECRVQGGVEGSVCCNREGASAAGANVQLQVFQEFSRYCLISLHSMDLP